MTTTIGSVKEKFAEGLDVISQSITSGDKKRPRITGSKVLFICLVVSAILSFLSKLVLTLVGCFCDISSGAWRMISFLESVLMVGFLSYLFLGTKIDKVRVDEDLRDKAIFVI